MRDDRAKAVFDRLVRRGAGFEASRRRELREAWTRWNGKARRVRQWARGTLAEGATDALRAAEGLRDRFELPERGDLDTLRARIERLGREVDELRRRSREV